jgi:hypothetical protein
MTKAKAPENRLVPGPKTPHVGPKLDFLDRVYKAYVKMLEDCESKTEKTVYFKKQAALWASTFGVDVPFETQLPVYDPTSGSDLSDDERASRIAEFRMVSS